MKREDMTTAAKFRATCETCGKRQPSATTHHTAAIWMRRHEESHRAATASPEPSTGPRSAEQVGSGVPGPTEDGESL